MLVSLPCRCSMRTCGCASRRSGTSCGSPSAWRRTRKRASPTASSTSSDEAAVNVMRTYSSACCCMRQRWSPCGVSLPLIYSSTRRYKMSPSAEHAVQANTAAVVQTPRRFRNADGTSCPWCLQMLSHGGFGAPKLALCNASAIELDSSCMEAAARLLVESTEADLGPCQNAVDTLQRQQQSDRSTTPALGEPPFRLQDDDSIIHDTAAGNPGPSLDDHASSPQRKHAVGAGERVAQVETALAKARGAWRWRALWQSCRRAPATRTSSTSASRTTRRCTRPGRRRLLLLLRWRHTPVHQPGLFFGSSAAFV